MFLRRSSELKLLTTWHDFHVWKLWQDLLLMEEILHQLIGSLSHYLRGFIHPRWCRISSISSITSLRKKWNFKTNSFEYLDHCYIPSNHFKFLQWSVQWFRKGQRNLQFLQLDDLNNEIRSLSWRPHGIEAVHPRRLTAGTWKWVFPKIGVPQNGWCIMENPTKMDDLGAHLFSETSKWWFGVDDFPPVYSQENHVFY